MSELLVGQVVANPLIVGLAVGAPASVLGYLGYRHTMKLDKAAAVTATSTANASAIQQIIDGLNQIVDNLQEDNKVLRSSVNKLTKRLAVITTENHDLKVQVADLTEQYGAP